MEEQQLADLFSEQVDRMLDGESTAIPPNAEDLQELLDIVGQSTSQTEFQAGSAAQETFQSQLADWFGLANGGSPMTILGLSKIWFISIVVVIITVITGAGLITVIATSISVFSASSSLPPTPTPTFTPTSTPTPTLTPTPTPTLTPTPTPEPDTPPTLIFLTDLYVAQLCQATYIAQRTLVNYGDSSVTNAALVWDVIEGGAFVDTVNINSPNLAETLDETENTASDSASPPAQETSLVSNEVMVQSGYANFSQLSVEQKVKLDVKVKVKDTWWKQPNGAKIKVKLAVKNKIKYRNDHKNSDQSSSQIITIIKQGAQWITLTGPAHPYEEQSLLVDH